MPWYQLGETCTQSALASARLDAARLAGQGTSATSCGAYSGSHLINCSPEAGGSEAAPEIWMRCVRTSGAAPVGTVCTLSKLRDHVPTACDQITPDEAAGLAWGIGIAWIAAFAVMFIRRSWL